MKRNTCNGKLDWYLQAFTKVRQQVTDDATAAALVEQVGKDVRTQMLSDGRVGGVNQCGGSTSQREKRVVNVTAPASEGQVALLRELGVKHVDPAMKRGAASQLIDELKAERASK